MTSSELAAACVAQPSDPASKGFWQLLLGHSNLLFGRPDAQQRFARRKETVPLVLSAVDCPVEHCMVPYSRPCRWAAAACVAALVASSCLDSALAQTAASAASSAAAPSAAPFQTLVDPALFTGATAAWWVHRFSC